MPNDRQNSASLESTETLTAAERRKKEESAAIATVEARVKAGEIDGAQADNELLEITLRRFHYLDEEQLEELRAFGREFNEEPEMVCTRLEPADFGDDDESAQP